MRLGLCFFSPLSIATEGFSFLCIFRSALLQRAPFHLSRAPLSHRTRRRAIPHVDESSHVWALGSIMCDVAAVEYESNE